MTVEPPSPELGSRSRRAFLLASGAVAAGSVAGLSGCGDEAPEEGEAPNPERDAAVLAPVLDQEYSSIVAYRSIATALHGDAARIAERFRAQEEEHADLLVGAIERIGRAAPDPLPATDYRAGFPELQTAADALAFAVDIERTAIASYLSAGAKLSVAALRTEVAALVTTEAEQLSILLLERGLNPVPEPFVGGDPLPL